MNLFKVKHVRNMCCVFLYIRKIINKAPIFREVIPFLFARIYNAQALKTYSKYVNFTTRTVLFSMPIKNLTIILEGE